MYGARRNRGKGAKRTNSWLGLAIKCCSAVQRTCLTPLAHAGCSTKAMSHCKLPVWSSNWTCAPSACSRNPAGSTQPRTDTTAAQLLHLQPSFHSSHCTRARIRRPVRRRRWRSCFGRMSFARPGAHADCGIHVHSSCGNSRPSLSAVRPWSSPFTSASRSRTAPACDQHPTGSIQAAASPAPAGNDALSTAISRRAALVGGFSALTGSLLDMNAATAHAAYVPPGDGEVADLEVLSLPAGCLMASGEIKPNCKYLVRFSAWCFAVRL